MHFHIFAQYLRYSLFVYWLGRILTTYFSASDRSIIFPRIYPSSQTSFMTHLKVQIQTIFALWNTLKMCIIVLNVRAILFPP